MQYRGYDAADPKDIERYAQGLIGKTFNQICEEDEISGVSIIKDSAISYAVEHESKKRKGGLGELVEERYFHYKTNNDSRPDFDEAGVELKVSPYKVDTKGNVSAKERLVIGMIDYHEMVEQDFYNSHAWVKGRLMLLVYYLYSKEIGNRLDYRIDYARLFSPPEKDVLIMEHDYNIILEKVRAGKAHELSEGDTMYLGACTKAATSADRRTQPFSDILAKPRAFCFKNSYMTYVLNNYIIPGKTTYEPILKDRIDVSFEDYVVEKISSHKGKTVSELCQQYGIESNAKNLSSILAFRMLDITSNNADEFVKAGIVVKTIRLQHNGKIKESMSFPTFKFKELIEEEWETSTFGSYLAETKFLFVVYKFDENDELHLQGCQFWNIPVEDLESDVRNVWEETKQVLIDGLVIEEKNGKHTNNFPKASNHRVSHVRPHAKNSKDTYELPDGRQYPKQCFWLNNSYILEQLDDNLK